MQPSTVSRNDPRCRDTHRSAAHRPADLKISTRRAGRIARWQSGGHRWEIPKDQVCTAPEDIDGALLTPGE
jgi:hypothetical protein